MSHPKSRVAQKFFVPEFEFCKIGLGFFLLFSFLYLSIVGCSTSSGIQPYSKRYMVDTVDQEADTSSKTEIDLEADEEESEAENVVPVFNASREYPSLENNTAINRQKLLTDIMGLMGTHYRRRGSDSTGFDCSGFAANIFNDALGINLPRSCREQYSAGKAVRRDSLKIGDLVFFKTRKKRPSHVGIYVGDGLFAHASLCMGVTISLMESDYYRKRYLGARRIVE
jgi:cell wall-associated NlpC family hydrolase